MAASGVSIFKTSLGFCGLAWTAHGIGGGQLPERDQNATRERLQARCPDFEESPVPSDIRALRVGVTAMLSGRLSDFTDVVLDRWATTPFRHKVYDSARTNLRGNTLTYGERAKQKALAPDGERWRPYRSIASWNLWRAFERARRLD